MQLRKLVVGAAVMGLAMSAGIAYASIPDSNKKVHGCWKAAAATNGTHKLTVIDTATTPTCPSGFNSLNWPTKGQLLYQNWTFFYGPYTSGQTVATFFGVPAGLMCVTASASAFTTTPGSFLNLGFTSPSAPSSVGQLFANEANTHKTLVSTATPPCQPVGAGNFSWTGSARNGSTTSDGYDNGSLTVQVFAN